MIIKHIHDSGWGLELKRRLGWGEVRCVAGTAPALQSGVRG